MVALHFPPKLEMKLVYQELKDLMKTQGYQINFFRKYFTLTYMAQFSLNPKV